VNLKVGYNEIIKEIEGLSSENLDTGRVNEPTPENYNLWNFMKHADY
jgi:hypothetical protein